MAVDNGRIPDKPARFPYFRHILLAVPILLVTLLMALLAWRVSADEAIVFGTEADAIYIDDGFYAPEKSAELGPYRWTEPLAQLRLPNWGPGRIHLIAEGIAGADGRIALKLGETTLAETTAQQGQPWQLQGWGETSDRTPGVSLESPPYNPPGEARDLGLLAQRLEIYAPDARLRAWLNIALLGLAGLLLYVFLLLRTPHPYIAALAGASIPLLFGPLAAYRDPWIDTVAWASSLALLIAVLLAWRARQGPGVRDQGPEENAVSSKQYAVEELHVSRITYHARSAFITIALTAALLLLYLGYMNAFDSDRMYQVAAGIAEYGRPTRYPGLETWTKYGFGQPLIAVPFYFLGKLFDLLGGDYAPITRLTVSFTNLAVTALTVLLLYKAARRFAGVGVSLAVAATYLLSTPALNYARTFFSEPAGALLLLAAILLILPDDGRRTAGDGSPPTTDNRHLTIRFLLSGLCLGAMLLFKPAFAIYWLPVGAAVLWLSIRSTQYAVSRTQYAVSSPLTRVSRFALRVSAFALGPLLALGIQAWYNYVRYSPLPDAIFRTGYEREPGFSTPILEGLFGILFSPGKSIFLYAPVVLLAPFGLWLMFRRHGSPGKLAALLIISEVALGIIFNALWWAWTGNFAWGPRLIMPILPLLVWPLATLGEKAEGSKQKVADNLQPPLSRFAFRVSRPAWLLLALLGALANLPGTFIDFQVYYRNYGLLLAGEPGEAVTIYDPAHSPLLVEAQYLLDGFTAAAYRPSLASAGMPPIWDTIIPLFLVVLSLVSLWFATSPPKRLPAKTPVP